MKNKSRFLACIIIIFMLSQISAYTDSNIADSNIAENAWTAEAVELLNVLGIIQKPANGDLKLEQQMTRAEFSTLIIRLLKLTEAATDNNVSHIFEDVQEDHWAAKEIYLVSKLGLINGYGNRTFMPENTVTYNEVAKVLVCALGYQQHAEAKGGYPTGYLIVASELGMLKRVNVSANDGAVRGIVVQIIFNALNVKLVEQTGYGKEIRYTVSNKTLLEQNFNVYRQEGIVTSVFFSDLPGSGKLKSNEIEIDWERYGYLAKTDESVLLGQSVLFYAMYNEDAEQHDVIYMEASERKASTEVIDISNMIKMDNEHIEYWKGNETYHTASVQISNTASLIYNNKYHGIYSSVDLSILSVDTGEIRLVDNDSNGQYDMVMITQYETYVVQNVNRTDSIIYDQYGQPFIKIEKNDSNFRYSITKGNNEVKVEDLRKGDVLSVARSKDDSVISIIVSDIAVKGKIEETGKDASGEYVILSNGEKYVYSKGYKNAIEAGNSNARKFKIDDEGLFYLNIQGELTAAQLVNSSEEKYGYLVDAGPAGSNIDSRAQFKVLTSDGDMEVFEGAKKIFFHNADSTNKKAESLTPRGTVEQLMDEGVVVHQLIRYSLNNDREISLIRLAKDGYDEDEFTLDATTPSTNTNGLMYDYQRFDSTYVADDDTVVFFIPTSGVIDQKTTKVGGYKLLSNEKRYVVTIYDTDDMGLSKAFVIKEAGGAGTATIINPSSKDYDIVLVDRVTQVVSKDGMISNVLYGIHAGVQKSFVVNEGVRIATNPAAYLTAYEYMNEIEEITELSKGDIIQVELDIAEEITLFKVLFLRNKSNAENVLEQANTHHRTEQLTAYTTVLNRREGLIQVRQGANKIVYYASLKSPVYLYDSSSKEAKISIASFDDIETYKSTHSYDTASKIFLRTKHGVVKEIVIYK